MFRNAVNKYATTFTTTLFLISAVSGVFLFFHSAQDIFKAMHEWLSMVLLLPVVFHLYKNWNSFLTYFKRKTIYLPVAASLIAAVAFGYATAGSQGGNPFARIARAMETAQVAEVAPLFDKTPDEMIEHLRGAGLTVAAAEDTLKVVGEASGVPAREVISVVARAK